MPGLCGLVSAELAARVEADLDRMIESLRHLPWYRVEKEIATNGNFGLGRVHLGGASREGRVSSGQWLHGEETDGYTRVERDPATGVVTIENDWLGMMPVFYAVVGGTFVFSTELKGVLAHPQVERKLDRRGLIDLLTYGFVLGEKTLVEGVHCLQGGTRLRFEPRAGRLEKERVIDFRQLVGRGAGGAREEELLERVNDCFQRAVETRCSADVAVGVSLSGGLDSRTIMAAIDHRRHRIKSLTLDIPGGADHRIAREIARLTNGLANHRFVENSGEFFARWLSYVREMVALTDGMYYDEACVMMSTLDLYREAGIEVVLRGHGGELARMHEAYELRINRHVRACRTQAALKEQLYRQMNVGCRGDEFEQLLVPELARGAENAARASLDETFEGVDDQLPLVDQVSCVYVQEYLRRQCVPSLAQLRSRVDVRMPYLDMDFVSAVLALPPATRVTTRVHQYLLARNSPALLAVTNINTGVRAGASHLVQQASRRWWRFCKHYLHYDRFPCYVDVPEWLRGPLREVVADVLLREGDDLDSPFQPQAVRNAFDKHSSGHSDRAALLMLLTIHDLWRHLSASRIDGTPDTLAADIRAIRASVSRN